MNIHQLSVLFDERQDRLLLRVNTREGQEVRLWLTRRIGLRLIKPLQMTIAKMESSNSAVSVADAQAQAMLVELKQQDFLQSADLKTPFATQGKDLPLGQEPMVVTEITLDVKGQAGVQIVFQDAGDAQTAPRACTLQMQAQLVHGMLHLLTKAVSDAQWQDIPQGQTQVPAQGTSPEDEPQDSAQKKRAYRH